MQTISLHNGMIARVDDDDFESLHRFRWRAVRKTKTWYARRVVYVEGQFPGGLKRFKWVYMHRQIRSDVAGQVDHHDNDGLNNQRSNLRAANQVQQCANTRKRAGCSSQFKGVCRRGKVWEASIKLSRRQKCLGRFPSEIEAAMAYNTAATLHFGEFAHLNAAADGDAYPGVN